MARARTSRSAGSSSASRCASQALRLRRVSLTSVMPASVIDSTVWRPSVGSSSRRTSPASTSEATVRDIGGVCTCWSSARAVVVIGPRLASAASAAYCPSVIWSLLRSSLRRRVARVTATRRSPASGAGRQAEAGTVVGPSTAAVRSPRGSDAWACTYHRSLPRVRIYPRRDIPPDGGTPPVEGGGSAQGRPRARYVQPAARQRRRVQHVAAVDDPPVGHQRAELDRVEGAVLGPLGGQDHHVGARDGLLRRSRRSAAPATPGARCPAPGGR